MGGTGEYYIEKSEIAELAQIIASAPNKRLVEFLDALLTKKELVDITRRIIIAKLLLARTTYAEISKKTRASKTTIKLVKQSLDKNDEILREGIMKHIKLPNLPHVKYPAYMKDPVARYLQNRLRKGKWVW